MKTFPSETHEEKEERRRATTRRRIKVIGSVLAMVVVARFLINDPPPPPAPDHESRPFRALPGVLANMSEEDRANLTPQMLASLRDADRKADEARPTATAIVHLPPEPGPVAVQPEEPVPALAATPRPAEPPRERVRDPDPAIPAFDPARNMLVRFQRGGHAIVTEAHREGNRVVISIDGSIRFNVPRRMVAAIREDAHTWEEPLPRGARRLKPAKGITIVLSARTARRISARMGGADEG